MIWGDLLFRRPLGKLRYLDRIGLAFQQRLQHPLSGYTENVGQHAAQLDVGVFQGLLDSVLFAGSGLNDLPAPPGQIPQFSLPPRRDKTGRDHGVAQQMRQPPRIFGICLVASSRLDLIRIRQGHLHHVFQYMKMGFQYQPVLSIMAWVHASCWIHSRSFLSSLTVVPNSRISDRASPFAGPVITQATKNFLPTSMPIQRSMTASIIVTPSCPGSDRRIVKDLLPRALRTNRGSPHDCPASFLYGLPPMELPAVPYDATILSHISISGDGGTRHVCFLWTSIPATL